jgi:trimeric autotransporter adhesin
MRTFFRMSSLALYLSFALMAIAQQVQTNGESVVPALVNFGGTLHDAEGKPLSGLVGITFALYKEAEGGAPLWIETQNVRLDATGSYSVMLGSTKSDGMPTDLFASGRARWLGIRVNGQDEQPRVLLLSVPYAMKAADAQTLGGLPASAFVQATSGGSNSSGASSSSPLTTQSTLLPLAAKNVTTTGGTAQHLPVFTTTSNIQNSIVSQVGTTAIDVSGKLGVNTTGPSETLDIRSGNAIVRGTGNFLAEGNTATLYIGDLQHPIEAAYSTGLSLGAFKAPKAIFIADFTGLVGVGTTTPAFSLDVNGSMRALGNDGGATGNGGNGGTFNGGGANNGFGGAGGLFTGGGSTTNSAGNGGTFVGGGGNAGPGGAGGAFTGGGSTTADGGAGGTFTGGGSTTADGGAGGLFTGGESTTGAAGDGIVVSPGPFGSLAGNFTGDVNVSGTIFAGTKDFKIDHPLDPANKYLVHASVESSEMKNIYDGVVTTDEQGRATVRLPEWFEALNGDFRYQLTVIGQFAQAIIDREIQNHEFTIRSSAPNVKVSWQVTGVRHDAYAKARPLVVEEQKDARIRGFYIHPELYGLPDNRGIEWVRHPEMMKKLEQMKAARARAIASRKP